MGQVNTIAVIGAGIMGRGIAHVAALGGYRTILEDLLPNALRKPRRPDGESQNQSQGDRGQKSRRHGRPNQIYVVHSKFDFCPFGSTS